MQIDGEVYRLQNPNSIRIQLAKDLNGGRLRVLQRVKKGKSSDWGRKQS